MKPNHSAHSVKHSAVGHLHCAVACALVLATAQATAATVTLATADAASAATTSFNSAGGWADGNAPAAGNDYVVALGDSAGLFLPTATATFAGDSLAIGDGSGASATAGFLSSGSTKYVWTIKHLILNQGGVWDMMASGDYRAIAKITVNSTAENPFVINLAAANVKPQFNANSKKVATVGIQGGENAVLVFRKTAASGTVYFDTGLVGSSFTAFNGKLVLDGVQLQGSNSSGAFGNMFSTASGFAADRIVLKNGATFYHGAANTTAWANSKTGITIDETGAKIVKPYANVTLKIPFVGGPLTITGSSSTYSSWRTAGGLVRIAARLGVSELIMRGTSNNIRSDLVLSKEAVVNVPRITLQGIYYSGNPGYSAGATLFCGATNWESRAEVLISGAANNNNYGKGILFVCKESAPYMDITLGNGGVIIPNDSTSTISQACGTAGEAITLGDFTYATAANRYARGKFVVKYGADNDAMDCITLGGAVSGVSSANPLVFVNYSDLPAASATGRYPILKVPASTLTLTEEMLDVSGIKFDDTSIAMSLTIEEQNGYWVASVGPEIVPEVTLLAGDSGPAATTAFNGNGQQWSDGLAPHAVPYLVALGTNATDALHFPTASATFAGTQLRIGDAENATSGRIDATTQNAATSYSFENLVLEKGLFEFHKDKSGGISLNGRISVASTSESPFVIEGAAAVTAAENLFHGGTNAVLELRGAANSTLGLSLGGANWGQKTFANYSGRVIVNNAKIVFGVLHYGSSSTIANAFTLRKGGRLSKTGANATWNSTAGIFVDATGGQIGSDYGGTLAIYNQITGGPVSFVHGSGTTTSLYGLTAVSNLAVSVGSIVNATSSATLDNARYTISGGAKFTIADGATFAPRTTLPDAVVTNAMLKVGRAVSSLRLDLCAEGVLSLTNGVCAAFTTTNATLRGGAVVAFDVDVENGVCDSLAVLGAATSLTATRESPLRILVKPADASFEPAPDAILAFDLLSLPASIGPVDKKCLELSFTDTSCLDGLKLYVLQQDGRQIVRLTNRNPGTCIMLR